MKMENEAVQERPEVLSDRDRLDGFVRKNEGKWAGGFLGHSGDFSRASSDQLEETYVHLEEFLAVNKTENKQILKESQKVHESIQWVNTEVRRKMVSEMWEEARGKYVGLLVGDEATQRQLGVWKMKARRGQPINVNDEGLLDLTVEIAIDRGWEPGGDWNMVLADELGEMAGAVEKKGTPPVVKSETAGFVVSEIEVSDDDLGKFRKRLIERIGLVESINVDKEALWGAMQTDFARMKGQYSVKLPEAIEQKLRVEFLARMELNAVGLYWAAVKAARSPDDSAYDTMEKSMSGCPTLSVETYSWLVGQRKYMTMENGKGVEEINLTRQIDRAMGEIYRRMLTDKPAEGVPDERLDMWLASEDEKNRVVEEVARRTGVNKGAVSLGWSLIEAECWAADVKKTHPAFRICSFSSWRIQRYKSNLPVQGGIRLVQEWRDDNPRAGQNDVPDSIFEIEGKTWARTGLRIWPGAEQAAGEGKYLEKLAGYMQTKAERLSPQLLVMEDLGLGAGVFDTLNEMVGKTTTRDLSPGLLGKLRGKLYLDLMNVLGDGGKSADPNKVVGPVVGKLLNEWARSYLWGASWANTDISDTAGMSYVLPTADLFAHFRDLVTAYDSDAGEGVNIGHKQGRYQSRKDAIEFVKWFYKLNTKLTDILFDSKQRVGIPRDAKSPDRDRRLNDSRSLTDFDDEYWLGKGVFGLLRKLPGKKHDPRWWLI